MPFVFVVPIIVPLCSIYLWCNQNVFKRISQRINTIYSGADGTITINCGLGILAKSLDGLPRTGFATPTRSANYGNRLSEKSESFFVLQNCSLRNVTAVCLTQGLPPQPTPPTMAIGSQRNLRAFLF